VTGSLLGHKNYDSADREWPSWARIAIFILGALLLFGFGLDRVYIDSKAITSPGSTQYLGPLVTVNGAQTYDPSGSISMVTVRSNMSPSLLEIIGAWLDDSIRIEDSERVLSGRTVEENRTLGLEQMSNSLDLAKRVALEKLGYDVMTESGVLIRNLVPGEPAALVLNRGDVLIEAEGTPLYISTDLVELLSRFLPGDDFTFSVQGFDGSVRSETVKLGDREGKAFLGVSVGTYMEMLELPFEIKVAIEKVGGPSAGLGLTLAILEQLGEGQLTGGLDVVATGTIDAQGRIGPIGGLEQKSYAVMQSGANIFLVPAGQMSVARAVVGDYVKVISVETLDDALTALRLNGGDLSGLK